MKPLFNVTVSSLKEIHDMPGTWEADDYRKLLEQLDVDDIEELSDSDLLDVVLMALQDMKSIDAADAVLIYKLQDSITTGARRIIVQDFVEDQHPWEEASDISLHARIFAAAVLSQKAFPAKFSKPDMMKLVLQVTAIEPEARDLLTKSPEPAFVTRLLADGIQKNGILGRLFEDQLLSQSFPEANGIIWQAEFSDQTSEAPPTANLTIYSCKHWLKAMKSISAFQSSA